MPEVGLEPTTYCLQDSCTTNCAIQAKWCSWAYLVFFSKLKAFLLIAVGGIRTRDLWLMRPMSYQTALPRYNENHLLLFIN